jgi:hypothetical protein
MVSLTGEPQLSQDDAAIEAMLANLGTTMSDGTFVLDGEPVYEFAPPKALTPPPAEASVPATLRDAVQFLNDCRNKPADAAQTLLLKRRKRHDGQMLEFVFEGELAHMKTKEGAAGCDDAVAALKRATPVPSLVFSAALCDACDRAYEPKRTGKTTDALEIVRNNGRLRGTAQQMTWRGKFSDPLDAMMALFVDDGNSDRSRRAIMRLESARYGGIAWGEDGQDHYLVVVLAESFADK